MINIGNVFSLMHHYFYLNYRLLCGSHLKCDFYLLNQSHTAITYGMCTNFCSVPAIKLCDEHASVLTRTWCYHTGTITTAGLTRLDDYIYFNSSNCMFVNSPVITCDMYVRTGRLTKHKQRHYRN